MYFEPWILKNKKSINYKIFNLLKEISNVESQKYREKLEQLKAHARKEHMRLPTKGLKIPTDGLQLLQSFYKPWLKQIKPMMKVCTN